MSTPAGGAIVGIGQTEFGKDARRSELQLASESIRAALADAQLTSADVDGLVSYTVDPVEEVELVRSLGVRDVAFSSRVPYAGSGALATLTHASAAIRSGAAETVVVYRALRARSGSRFGGAKTASSPTSSHGGTTFLQWCMPFGVLTPASWMALNARVYMDRFSVTNRDIGTVSVQMRKYAATNPAAWYFNRPLTIDEHQAARWIVEPVLRRPDCCQETDGSVAFIVTAAERAVDRPQRPVFISHATMAALFEAEVATDHYRQDLSVMEGSAALARRLWARSGLAPRDIDVALIYDAFAPMLMMQLEAWGFCGAGEAKELVAAGELDLGGDIPCNPHGGLIGEGYIHGLNLVSEAVRQLRGTAANQVVGAQRALVAGGRGAAILANTE